MFIFVQLGGATTLLFVPAVCCMYHSLPIAAGIPTKIAKRSGRRKVMLSDGYVKVKDS